MICVLDTFKGNLSWIPLVRKGRKRHMSLDSESLGLGCIFLGTPKALQEAPKSQSPPWIQKAIIVVLCKV